MLSLLSYCLLLLLVSSTARVTLAGQNDSAIKIRTHNDGLNKGAVQLASQLAQFSCPHNQMFIPCYKHNIMTSGYLWPQSRQQNCVTNSKTTTISSLLSETPIIVEDKMTIHEGEMVNCEPDDITATDSKLDLLRYFEFHAGPSERHKLLLLSSFKEFDFASAPEMISVSIKLSVTSLETRKIIPKAESKTGGDERSAFKFDYIMFILLIQLITVLLVMSFVVFCFLHFKLAKSTTDVELQELVIVPHTLNINVDDINHVTDERDKGISQTAITSTTVTDTDRQIQAKLPDVINSRD